MRDPEYWWDQDAGWTSDDQLRGVKSSALAAIPEDVAEWISDNCLCLCERGDSAAYISQERIGGRSVLIFSEGSLRRTKDNLPDEVFLHEAAHAYLRHRHPLDGRFDEGELRQGNEINDRQELEAWRKVGEWLIKDESWVQDRSKRYSGVESILD